MGILLQLMRSCETVTQLKHIQLYLNFQNRIFNSFSFLQTKTAQTELQQNYKVQKAANSVWYICTNTCTQTQLSISTLTMA